MMGRVAERERRMIFGEVAESYHHARPDYPAELIADVVAWAGGPGAAALEVGAGTGKATIPLARSGLSVVALEPSRDMADVLRRETADLPRVSVVDAGFEDWEPTASAFDLGGVVTMPTVSRLLRARRV
jgi:SAM-dependent methyltransferase